MAVYDIAESGGNFSPHPEGPAEGIIVHVTDLGKEERNPFGGEPRHRMIFRFQSISHYRDDESPYLVNIYTTLSSWHSSGFVTMRQRLAGRKFEKAELQRFDTKSVVGVRCTAIVEHKEGKQGAYATIAPESMYRHKDQNVGQVWDGWDWEDSDARAIERNQGANNGSFASVGASAGPAHPQSTGNDPLPF